MSNEPAKKPPTQSAEADEQERDELAEFLALARRLIAVPKEEIDAARSNGAKPQPE